jgi:hypothetical protein
VKRALQLALVFAGATAAAGWWTVPIVAAIWVRVAPRARRPVLSCTVAAAAGCALLLGWTALQGPVDAVARRVGGAVGLPPWGFVLVTLLFPAFLAGAAAVAARPAAPR